jgi:PAS domain S-box-containing protein
LVDQPYAPDGEHEQTFDADVFRDAIEDAPEAVFWLNCEGRFVYVNRRACASLGYTPAELSALRVWDIDPNLDPQKWSALWSQPAIGRTIETLHRRKEGTTFPVEVSAKDLETDRGRVRIAIARDITQRVAMTVALRRTQFAVDRAREAVFWVREDGAFAYVNDAACNSLGYTHAELLRMNVFDIDPDVTLEEWREVWRRRKAAGALLTERTHRSKSGRRFPVQIASNFMQFEGVEYSCAYARDLTDAKRADEEKSKLEAQLLHAQRMESVGRLAGGVAHDFNNSLAVIIGYAELATRQLNANDPVLEFVREIEKAATRARDTTRQLLAFSRKERISPRSVDLNELVGTAKNALSRLIGENVDLRFVPAVKLPRILFDPSQMEQILINLVVNARDAVSNGGRIVIQTATVRLDETYCRDHVDATPGSYVVLTVMDNGVGIDAETRPHIFEPFFTTKETGKGTGLGLAMVYGMVRQHGGSIDVDTSPGRGTTFRLYVPAADRAEVELEPVRHVALESGHGTILIVEDDAGVRTMTQSMLETLGYSVLVASTPLEALGLCGRVEVRIDLVVSDVVMPEMKGPELRDRIRLMRPDLDVLFISGYASDAVFNGYGEPQEHFLQKPFTIGALAEAARRAMQRARSDSRSHMPGPADG